MTQALNLALFANKLNTSGATDNTGLQNSSITVTAGTGLSGGGAVALGGTATLTNAGVTSIVAGTGITVTSATGAVTVNATSLYAGPRGQVFNSNGTFTIPTGITALKVTVMGGGGGGAGQSSNCNCNANPVSGGEGGASSIASGTQSISTMTANGGGGAVVGVGANQGTVSGQAINGASIASNALATGGSGPYGFNGGLGGRGIQFYTGLTPGANLAVTRGAGGNAGGVQSTAGSGGIVLIEF